MTSCHCLQIHKPSFIMLSLRNGLFFLGVGLFSDAVVKHVPKQIINVLNVDKLLLLIYLPKSSMFNGAILELVHARVDLSP